MKKEEASSTAKLILLVMNLAARDKALTSLISPVKSHAFAALGAHCGGLVRLGLRLLNSSFFCRLARRLEALILPGFVAHVVARKAMIGKLLETELDLFPSLGTKQVLILGAGFDVLGLDVAHTKPDVQVFEVDHPATQGVKRKALSHQPNEELSAPPNLHLVPLDLAESPLADCLNAHSSWNSRNSTIVVIEGVLMYLQEREVIALFQQLFRMESVALTVIFTYMNRTAAGISFENEHSVIGRWLRYRSEVFHWGASPQELTTLVQKCGGDLLRMIDHYELARLLNLAPHVALARGERLAIARRS